MTHPTHHKTGGLLIYMQILISICISNQLHSADLKLLMHLLLRGISAASGRGQSSREKESTWWLRDRTCTEAKYIFNSDEYAELSEDIDQMRLVDMNFCSSGLHSAKRIMENMGWKEGKALGKSGNGTVELIQPTINKHGVGLGWNQTH